MMTGTDPHNLRVKLRSSQLDTLQLKASVGNSVYNGQITRNKCMNNRQSTNSEYSYKCSVLNQQLGFPFTIPDEPPICYMSLIRNPAVDQKQTQFTQIQTIYSHIYTIYAYHSAAHPSVRSSCRRSSICPLYTPLRSRPPLSVVVFSATLHWFQLTEPH